MKLAVQNPHFIWGEQTKNFDGYNFEFFKQFKPIIYCTQIQSRYFLYKLIKESKFRRHVKKHLAKQGVNIEALDFAFSIRELNRKADALVCFNGRPDLPDNSPPAQFNGLKVYHVMDYVFRATESHQALVQGGADYVMGYTDHGRYCQFFQKFYSNYKERVIPVPFGYGKRFENKTPFSQRALKVIALGSVNPVDDPMVQDRSELQDYIDFYHNIRWTHAWRRLLVEHEDELSNIMDSQLPHFPQTKNPSYDAVAMMNRYVMYANDEGLMAFPPARTYEGTAAGAVMVCSDHPSYSELGFQDGVNCIKHRKHDISDFREKVTFYIQNPDKLEMLSKESTKMVRDKYSHEQVARTLYEDIFKRWQS